MPRRLTEFKGDTRQHKWLEKTATNALLGFAPKGCPELLERSQSPIGNKNGRINTTIHSFETSVENISIECNGANCSYALSCPLFLTGMVVPATGFPGPVLMH